MTTPPRPFVSIVMPALNEELYIADAIASVLPRVQSLDVELLVLDGGSTDDTRRVVAKLAAEDRRIKLLQNDRRIQSAAVNIASEVCDERAAVLVRADCHATYPRDFVKRCVDTLINKQSSSVVVPMRAIGRTPLQKAIAAVQNSWLGNGGSEHRMARYSGYVDHGHHAAFHLSIFRMLGGYDETAPYNEDAEFDARLIDSGGRIYLDGSLTIDYYPRTSLTALARQYYRHGWGRANTTLKHSKIPRLRQGLPAVVLLACIAGLGLVPFFGVIGFLPLAGYALSCLAWAVAFAVQSRDMVMLLAAPAAMTMHMSWAIGFFARLVEQLRRNVSSKRDDALGRRRRAARVDRGS